jgi:hypothetical protein
VRRALVVEHRFPQLDDLVAQRAARSNSRFFAADFICDSRSFTSRAISSFGICRRGSVLYSPRSSATFLSWSVMSRIALTIPSGEMPCSSFQERCVLRRRFVSSIACRIDAVMLSAYMITRVRGAARPRSSDQRAAERR